MTWTPPPLKTAHLDLLALTGEPPEDFKNREDDLHGLSGLPSNWTIFLKGSEEGIGSIGYIRWERDLALAELGFILKHSERRRGYMEEACRAVIAFGFSHMALNIVEGRSLLKNIASSGLLEKVGLKKTGRVSVRLSQKGASVDLEVYRLYASDLSSSRPSISGSM